MTELSFLVELLLNHKLPKATKDLIAERIKTVESSLAPRAYNTQFTQPRPAGGLPIQAASTQAILDRNPDLIPPAPVAVIAQTPATAEALNKRQESINLALSGKSEPGRTSPRKF